MGYTQHSVRIKPNQTNQTCDSDHVQAIIQQLIALSYACAVVFMAGINVPECISLPVRITAILPHCAGGEDVVKE
jgi:hypothetical protein